MASIGMRSKTAQRYVDAVSLQYKLPQVAKNRLQVSESNHAFIFVLWPSTLMLSRHKAALKVECFALFPIYGSFFKEQVPRLFFAGQVPPPPCSCYVKHFCCCWLTIYWLVLGGTITDVTIIVVVILIDWNGNTGNGSTRVGRRSEPVGYCVTSLQVHTVQRIFEVLHLFLLRRASCAV